jgi:formate dehydrogenase alpha subunit
VAGLAASFGSGAMTNSIAEIEHADVIFIIGSNTTQAHPVIGLGVKRAVRSGSATLIVADPRRIEVARLADVHLRLECGTDVALINGLMNVILAEGLQDAGFVASRTEGIDELRAAVEPYTPEAVERITGVPAEDIRRAARLYAGAETATILYTLGITQHTTGTDNVKSLANLAMLTGNVGKPSSGVNPLRGQNNVQGACDMGALPNVYPGYQKVDDPVARAKFEAAWGVPLDESVGRTLVEMTDGVATGDIRAMYIMGENPAMSDADANHVRAALADVEFLLVQDIFLTETAELADVVLPASSFAEKSGCVTNTERRVQRMNEALAPLPGTRPDWRIVCELSSRMGHPMDYASPDDILHEIADLTPSYGGIRPHRLADGGLQWPCPDEDHPGTPYLHKGEFVRGLGKFHAVEFRPPHEPVDDDYPLILTTGRSLYHYDTVMTRKSPGLDTLCPEATLEINPADALRLGLAEADYAKVSSRRGSILARAEVTETTPVGTVYTTFHFREAAANLLTTAAYDPVTKTSEYKVCAVRVEAASGSEDGP